MRYISKSELVGRREAARRARVRRRRIGTLGAGVVLAAVVALIVAVLAPGDRTPAASRQAARQPTAPGTHVPRAKPRHDTLAATERLGNDNIRRLAQLGLPVYCAGPSGNAVAFTFDDGPGPYTHFALRKLTQAGERATFFVVGRSMDNFPGYLPRELAVAAIADHSYTHPVLPALAPSAISSELGRTKQKIETSSGQSVDLFRPPYGSRSPTVDGIAKQLGMLDIIWDVDSADSLGADYAGIIKNVEAGLHPGAIILMHENRGQTIRALTTLLPELHRRHLHSVSLPQLFASDPPSEAQLRRGPAGCGASGKVGGATGG